MVSAHRSRALSWLTLAGAALSAPALLAASCSATGGGTGGAGGAGGGGAGGDLFPDANDDAPIVDEPCQSISKQANEKPLHLFVLLDKSTSMAGSKWDAAQLGLKAFLEAQDSAGIDVALGVFPRPPDATPACDQNAYKTPLVDFGLLPDHAADVSLALQSEAADGFSSPVYPALGGALLRSLDVLAANPGDAAAVLLVTDGAPQGPAPLCGGVDPEDPNEIAALAAAAAAMSPPVLTFVIGLPGVDQSAANTIAAGGGTGSAILVMGDVASEFTKALAKAKGEALPCAYPLPTESEPGYVNVEIGWGGGDPVVVPLNAACGGDGLGWTWDVPAAPTEIVLCPASCAALKADLQASIDIALGCPTVITN